MANISYGVSSSFYLHIIIILILQAKVWDTEDLRNEL